MGASFFIYRNTTTYPSKQTDHPEWIDSRKSLCYPVTSQAGTGGVIMRKICGERLTILGLVLLGCTAMAYIDGVVQPGYLVKSLWKLVFFLALPLVLYYRNAPQQLKKLFALKTGMRYRPLLLGLAVYCGILLLYFTIGRFFDFSQVVGALDSELGIDGKNFIFVSLYISFINSLLEEFFFRGFGFLALRETCSRKFCYLFSAAAFALYHVAMMAGWFRLDLLTLLIALLMVAGAALNYFNERSRSLWFSWFIHMFANFAINTVGFLLFGIL